jgi:hypothetical protein
MDSLDKIEGWSIQSVGNNTIFVEPAEKTDGYSIQITEEGAILRNILNGSSYELKNNDLMKL